MTSIEHVGFADKLIEPAGALRLWAKAAITRAQIVTLQIREFLRLHGYDELRHIQMTEIATHEFELLRGVVPPFQDMRCPEPSLDRR
jgi:hypothetical protein